MAGTMRARDRRRARQRRSAGGRSRSELALALALALPGCGDDGGAADASTGDSTGAAPLDDPYGPCGEVDAPTPCDEAAASIAACAERSDPGTGQLYRVCEPTCAEDADCPAGAVGNASPQCAEGRCALACNPEANVCPAGTVCVDGTPAQCMWPVDAPAAHDDAESFCATACGPCGASLLLPWTADCESECIADLADCDAAMLDEVFACTGGEGCPNGGGAVAQCLDAFACVQGSG